MLSGNDAHDRALTHSEDRPGDGRAVAVRRRRAAGALVVTALTSALLTGWLTSASGTSNGASVSGPSGVSGASRASGASGASGVSGGAGQGGAHWVVAWTSAMAWRPPGPATNATVRQIVPLGAGGTAVRVQLSNLFGAGPLTVGEATVAVDQKGAAVVPGTVQPLTFGDSQTVTIPAGATATSDPAAIGVTAGEQLAVSVYVPGTAAVTAHYDAGPMSYGADFAGNLTQQQSGAGFLLPSTWDRWVSAVMVAAPSDQATVVIGDSISDGFNVACGRSPICQLTDPWPEVLDGRLRRLPSDQRVSVVDESITANTLTPIATPTGDEFRGGGGGPPGITRISSALQLPGVDRVVVLLGTNDLWFGATAAQVIAGYRNLLAQAKAAHVGVIGVTLLPRAGSEGWTPLMEQYRQQVNHWILTSKAFPVVLDLATVVANVYNGACNPTQMYPPYDSGDHLHPNTAGQTAMADAIPTTLLGAGSAPAATPLVPVTPTPHCPHPAVVTVNAPFPVAASSTSVPPATVPTTTTPSTVPPTTQATVPATAAPHTRPAATGGTGTPGWVAPVAGMGLLLVGLGLSARRGRRRRGGRPRAGGQRPAGRQPAGTSSGHRGRWPPA